MSQNKILILSELLVPELEENKRGTTESILYRTVEKQNFVMGAVPYATLLGPAILGAALLEAGYEVKLLECCFRALQRENLTKELKKNYKYILLTTTFIELTSQLEKYASLLRTLSPRSILIFGGPTLITNLAARKIPDYFILGEGEHALPALLKCLDSGESPDAIPGIGFFRAGQEVFTAQKLIPDLDSTPFPAWNLVSRRPDEYYSIYTQRGCHWRCAFCSYPANEGFKLRLRSIDSIIREMRENHSKWGIFRYVISDSTFTHPRERCLELLAEFRKLPFPVEWVAYGRVDNIDDEMGKALSESGCRGIYFGCDSGDPRILSAMKKGFTREQMVHGAKTLRKFGVPFTASWIVGFPGETRESVMNTWKAIQEVDADENLVHTFSVLGNSPVGMRPNVFSITGQKLDWQHASMGSHEARRWTEWIVKSMTKKGLHFGSTFDRAWLRTAQLNETEVRDFFNTCEEVNFYRGRFKQGADTRPLRFPTLSDAERELSRQCERLWKESRAHPAYGEAGLF